MAVFELPRIPQKSNAALRRPGLGRSADVISVIDIYSGSTRDEWFGAKFWRMQIERSGTARGRPDRYSALQQVNTKPGAE